MQPNSDIVISDTSCLILLKRIGELDLLRKLSKRVFVTPAVQAEYGEELPAWIHVKEPYIDHYQRILEMDLDSGEASSLALCISMPDALLIVDELKGRRIAQKLNLRYSGTLGMILKAKQTGVIPSVAPLIQKIKQTNFWVTNELLEFLMRKANE